MDTNSAIIMTLSAFAGYGLGTIIINVLKEIGSSVALIVDIVLSKRSGKLEVIDE